MSRPPRRGSGGAPDGPDPLVGRVIAARYRVDGLVARGGMARVYRARDERLDRDVAVKVLSPPYADDPAFVARFLDEARAAASISHPSLVHVYDSGSDGDVHYIVMELLDRHRSLRQVLDEHGPLSPDEVLRIGLELLAGLRAVHERGLVHCDVKAGNVMLGPAPAPAKLIDFGIAQPAHEGLEGDTSIGSLPYMSPEQLHGERLTPASDLFSLGVVLYEALTGRLPYPGASPTAVSEVHARGGVRPPSTIVEGIPGRLDEAILQALRRDPAGRFRSADAMDRALRAATDDQRAAREEETRVVRRRTPTPAPPQPGYVPPSLPDVPPAEPPVRRPPRPVGRRPERRSGSAGLIGSLVLLAAAAAVVVFVIVPLLAASRGGGAGPSAGPSVTAPPGGGSDRVVVPDTMGMSTHEAIELAQELGLDWTVRCAQDPAQPEGIIDQEPAPGTEVPRGAPFTMFSARIADCR